MFEYHTPYTLGKKTFFFYFLYYGWWMTILGIVFVYFAISTFFDGLIYNYLFSLSDYIPAPDEQRYLYLELFAVTGLSFILLAFLRTYVMYSQYKFYFDKDAMHYREGVFRIKEFRIPYFQISNIEIEKPYHFRMVGLSRVDVVMSSSNQAFQYKNDKRKHLIPMIDSRRAKHLAKHILKHTGSRNRSSNSDSSESEDETEETNNKTW